MAGLVLFGLAGQDKSATSNTTKPTTDKAILAKQLGETDQPTRVEHSEPKLGLVEIDRLLASIEKQVMNHQFGNALLDLKELSACDLKPAQTERFGDLEARAKNGFSIIQGLKRTIKRNPGRLVELFEGRYRKILKAGNRGIQFTRPDQPGSQSRSMAWNQISIRGIIALLEEYDLAHTQPVEVRAYLAQHDHVIVEGKILTRSESESRRRQLAAQKEAAARTEERPDQTQDLAEFEEKEQDPASHYQYRADDNLLRIGRDRDEGIKSDPANRIEHEATPQPLVEKQEEDKEDEPARIESPEQEERKDRASRMERRGYVQYRGRWMTQRQRRIIEDTVDPAASENVKVFGAHRFSIARPANGQWSFGPGSGDQEVFTLQKRDGGIGKVRMVCYQYMFNINYVFPSQAKVDGGNASGLLKRHQVLLRQQHPDASVRKKMWKTHFHKEMTPFRTVLRKKDGTYFEIFSIPSSQGYADRTFVFVIEYASGEYAFAHYGVETIVKSFDATDR